MPHVRAQGLLLLAALVPGCFFDEHECWDEARAQGWLQPEYWDAWPSAPSGLEADDASVGDGLRWPEPPAGWRGNHSVRFASMQVRDGHDVTIGPLSESGLLVSAFLPQRMARDDREAALRTALAAATDAPDADVDRLVADLMAADGGGDSTGRFMARWVGNRTFDLEGLAALGPWEPVPERVGRWHLVHGAWTVAVDLDTRSLREGWQREMTVDAGGFVRGPFLDAALSPDELRAQTAVLALQWGLPEPTFEAAATEALSVCE